MTRPLDDWLAVLREAGVPRGGVRSVAEALHDPQILAREMVATIDHPALGPIRTLGVPVKLSDTPGAVRTPPPRLGEHTRQVLRDDLEMDDGADSDDLRGDVASSERRRPAVRSLAIHGRRISFGISVTRNCATSSSVISAIGLPAPIGRSSTTRP